MADLDITDWPHLEAWQARVQARPAVIKGSSIPIKVNVKAVLKDEASLEAYTALNRGWAARVEKE